MPIKMLYTYPVIPVLVNVYDIAYDSTGYPLFLIYYENQWIRKSAKHFQPLEHEPEY